MTDDNRERAPNGNSNRWVETVVLWVLICLAGIGLWLSAADPLFGGPEIARAALTIFAFFTGIGVVATLFIWCWPAFWNRWFHRMPAGENTRLGAATAISHLAYLGAGVLMVCWIGNAGVGPVAAGSVAGSLAVLCLLTDIVLHHWLGQRRDR
jgi:hypothetical protein